MCLLISKGFVLLHQLRIIERVNLLYAISRKKDKDKSKAEGFIDKTYAQYTRNNLWTVLYDIYTEDEISNI